MDPKTDPQKKQSQKLGVTREVGGLESPISLPLRPFSSGCVLGVLSYKRSPRQRILMKFRANFMQLRVFDGSIWPGFAPETERLLPSRN